MEHKPKLSPDSKEKIGRTLIRYNPFLQATSDGKIRYWFNVKFKGEYDRYYTFSKNMSHNQDMNKNTSLNNIYNISKSVIFCKEK